MRKVLSCFIIVVIATTVLHAGDPVVFNTEWIPSKPEVLTYKSTSPQGEGFYQISLSKRDSIIEIYLNILTPGFTKTVSGTMTSAMRPLQSISKIIVADQVIMDTKCLYENSKLIISTAMIPYNQIVANTIAFTQPFVDLSQVPLVARTLRLEKGTRYTLTSINPQTNELAPLTVNVIDEEPTGGVDCYKAKLSSYEGESIYWIEKGSRHRVMKVEQPDSRRTTELIK